MMTRPRRRSSRNSRSIDHLSSRGRPRAVGVPSPQRAGRPPAESSRAHRRMDMAQRSQRAPPAGHRVAALAGRDSEHPFDTRSNRVRFDDVPDFRLVAPFEPTGDQPAAIERLADGLEAGCATRRCWAPPAPARRSTLAWTIAEAQQADARPRPQQDARRPALRRVPRVLPRQRRRVLRQLLRLLPARGVPAPVATRTSRRTRSGTTRSTGSATPRPTRCSSGAT